MNEKRGERGEILKMGKGENTRKSKKLGKMGKNFHLSIFSIFLGEKSKYFTKSRVSKNLYVLIL
jgi:hypothetical protein